MHLYIAGTILLTFVPSLVPYAWRCTLSDTSFKFEVGFGLALVGVLIVVNYVADLWGRSVEVPRRGPVKWFHMDFVALSRKL